MTNPAVLLLDEPLEGLAPIIVEELTAAIHRMGEEGIALVLIEQHADVALRLTKEAVMIERGIIAHRAQSSDLLDDRDMLDRYLGLRLQERHGPAGPPG